MQRPAIVTTANAAAIAALSLAQVSAVAMPPSQGAVVAGRSKQVVETALARQTIPGVSVAIVSDGRIVLDRAYGLSDVAKRTLAGPGTSFEIGSITKQFTAAAILQLEERGELRLSDRLGRYVPEYARAQAVTIEELLYQTSGIPDHINDVPGAVKVISSSPGTFGQAVALVKNLPLHFKPGTQYEYSNTNYLLLGMIVARVSHEPFDVYIAKNIFGPAHMTHSAFLKDEPSLTNMAVGYAFTPAGNLAPAGHIGYGWSGGAGSIVSTAGDVARWDLAFFDGRIVSPSDVARAIAPARLNGISTGYGFGWDVDRLDGIPILSHGGAMLGFTSVNDVFPSLHANIVVLTNSGNSSPDAIAKGILASMDPEFARRRNAASPGENPSVTAQIRTVWTQLHRGTIDRSQLTRSFSGLLDPARLSYMHSHFAAYDSGPQRWIFKGKQTTPDASTTYTYRVLFPRSGLALLVTASIAQDGKVAGCDTDYD